MKRFSRLFFSVISILLIPFIQYSSAKAQSNALSIIPRKDYTLNPGQIVNDTLTVSNLNSSATLNLELKIVDFEAMNETGSPKLINDENAPAKEWSLKEILSVPEQITLDRGKSTNVPIKLTVPSNIGAGTYYSAIEYIATNPGEPDRVNIAASGVTLLFVNIPGTASELLNFKQFGAYVPGQNGGEGNFSGLFIDKKPQVIAYRLSNNGNVAEQPKGNIVLKDMFGKKVTSINNANPKNQIALRGQTRRFEACIKGEVEKQSLQNGADVESVVCRDPSLKPGRYTALLTILYGTNGGETREITASTSFWYLPWWFLVLVLVVLAAIAGVITFIVFKIRGLKGGRRK